MNFIQASLPGVFTNNPIPFIDGSLWTIKAEVTLYVLLPFIIPMLVKKPLRTYGIIFCVASLWFFYFKHVYAGPKADALAKQFIWLSCYFFFGSLLATNEAIFSRLKELTIFSMVAFVFLKNTDLSFLIEPIAYSSVVILFCTGMCNEIKISQYGDLSYGMYLYHWPIIQLLQHFGVFDKNAYLGLLLTILLTVTLAFTSWNLLESRFLKRSHGHIPKATGHQA